jgi:FkbM family methyltransferase
MFHSQEKQDQLLETHVFKGFKRGVFVDVGAWDGVTFNNTLFFERERQWTGLNLEPLPDKFQELVVNRPACTNLNLAVSDREGEADFLAMTGYTSMLSGLPENYDPRHRKRIERETAEMKTESALIKVSVKRLDTIFREHDIRRVHYLSVDAEGSEFNILRSIDFSSTFIDLIGFEANFPETSHEIRQYLASKGYIHLPIANAIDVFMIHKDSAFTLNHLRSPHRPLSFLSSPS